ncbi:MAG: S-layer homology domain-containing protein [Fimbriimonadales bacterium]
MRVGVVILLSGIMMLGAFAQFSDVPPNNWAYQAIRELVRLRILAGFPDRTFEPNRQVSRAEFAQAVARAIRVVDERIRQVEGRINAIAPESPAAPQPSPLQTRLQELQQAVQELQQLRSAVETLQRLAQEFETEMSGLSVSVRDLRRDFEALNARLQTEERRRNRLTGDVLLAVFGTHSYDKRSAFTYNGNAISPSGKFLQSVGVLHELGLQVDVPVNERIDAKATFIIGNYLPYTRDAARSADSLATNTAAYTVGATDVAIWEAYIDLPLELFGREIQARVGRIPLKLTPYTLQRIDPDYYIDAARYDDGAFRADGAALRTSFGGVDTQLFLVSSYGIRSNTVRFFPIRFANHNASVSAPVDQMLGLRLQYPFRFGETPLNIGATYLAAGVGQSRTFEHIVNTISTNINRADVLAVDLSGEFSGITAAFDYAVSILLRGDNRVVSRNNTALDLRVSYPFNERWQGTLGYREIEPFFVAPGNWGRIGYLYNPSDLKGTYFSTRYQVDESLSLALAVDAYTGTAKLPFNRGYQGRDRVRRIQLDAHYRYTPRLRFHLTYENVGWEINSFALNSQRGKPEWNYLTLRAVYQLADDTELSVLYQYINADGKGVALLSGGPSPASNRAGVFATQVGYRF